ncbi:hypothetical protein FKG94_08975 [Exilibacterium tricleocarpae]|uniref:Copper resistance protein D domain-containing protein n=1 Tax=Exilibacterium tricleocarpae TaxID=2591008 RepID=A0A545TVI3_9GAMM|nr:hypothetical protein [Exilibacterium tricleocarpae]TQV81226.1 hypothetical protein FKG94_08975 [Exilibacterium tricleocarpae]
MGITELAVLKWLHIIAMVYWLGGEWGVFQTSYNVVNRKLPMDERRRHMETAYRIDILARTGIILLLPLGLHMGVIWGVQPFGGGYLIATWVFFAFWLGLCWAAFVYRETDRGIRLTRIDEAIRFVVIPLLLISSFASLMGYGPFNAETGQKWFSAKVLIYALLLVIGLKLRFIMREWTVIFRQLAQKEDPVLESTLEKSIQTGRNLAYVYWIGIATVAFFGATKPF